MGDVNLLERIIAAWHSVQNRQYHRPQTDELGSTKARKGTRATSTWTTGFENLHAATA